MNEPIWYQWAKLHIGVKENPDKKVSNPKIIDFRKVAKIALDGDDSLVPWCAIFVNACMEATDHKGSGSAAARSFLTWGVELTEPTLGCVVVLNRPGSAWQGHVGLYAGEDDKRIYILGGNQGDAVRISPFAKERVIGYRWPMNVPLVPTGRVKYTSAEAEPSDR